MAPRQLLLELEEVDMAAEKGSKRVRVDRADESSTQVRLPLRATARFTSLAYSLQSQRKTYNLIRIEPPNTLY